MKKVVLGSETIAETPPAGDNVTGSTR